MRFDADPDRDHAYLSLDEEAAVTNRLGFTDDDCRLAWGINLAFDAHDRLVGVEFEHAHRQVPEGLLSRGEGLRLEYDAQVGAAYLYLQPIGAGGVAETLAFGEDENRPAWGLNLDFDRGGRLVGIEFESGELAPASLLAQAERI